MRVERYELLDGSRKENLQARLPVRVIVLWHLTDGGSHDRNNRKSRERLFPLALISTLSQLAASGANARSTRERDVGGCVEEETRRRRL